MTMIAILARAFRTTLLLLLLVVAISSARANTTLLSDNFDSDTAGALPAGWTAITGTWAVGTNNPVSSPNTLGSTTRADGDFVIYTGATATADTQIFFDQKLTTFTASSAPSIGAVLRSNSAGTNAYVAVAGESGTLGTLIVSLYKKVSGTYTLLSTTTVSGFVSTDTLNVRAQAAGAAIAVKIWPSRTTEPVSWSLSVTDSSVTAAGYDGMYYGLDKGSAVSMGVDDLVITAISSTTIAANSAAIVYSPYNWSVTGSGATSINPGSYFRTLFTGTTVALTFNVANNSAPLSQVECRIDAYNKQSPYVAFAVAASAPLTMPADTSAYPYHLLECVVKSTSETINRWNNPSNTAVVLTGLMLASGATAAAPAKQARNCLLYSDSIGEGVRTVNQTATNDTDRNDVLQEWSYGALTNLGCEFGIVAFGGSGYTVTGSGNVPGLSSSYNYIMSGLTRSFSPNPDLTVIQLGTNDQSATATAVQSAAQTALNGLLSAISTSPIIVASPYGGYQATALQAAISAVANSRVRYLDTTRFLTATYGVDSLGLHPTGANAVGLLTPQMATALSAYLNPATYAGGFHP